MKNLLAAVSILLLLFACAGRKSNPSTMINITNDSLLGKWYTGPGTKYNYYQNGVVEQPLGANYGLMDYKSDGTLWHEGHNKTMTSKIEGTNVIIYDMNTSAERFYKVESFNKDSLVVYGPFKKGGSQFDPNALFRLTQYRKKKD